ncbi:MAG: pyridoxamine 5'-phosphate oxidase family protein [Chlamydiota bacterium]
MDLSRYFQRKRGLGVLATADARGRVTIALYARPHFVDGKTVAFIMADRLSHRNLRENLYAAYLFAEEGEGYRGVRLYLTMTGEEKDSPRIGSLRRSAGKRRIPGTRFLVSFRVDRVLPLVGAGKIGRAKVARAPRQ